MARRYKIFLIVAAVSLIADQLTKVWARTLPTDDRGYGVAKSVIANFWDWRLSFNTGSAFGLFRSQSSARIFLTLVGIVAIVAIVWMLRKAREDQRLFTWALGLVAGGAIGNVIDRVLFGKVTDFVVWKYYEHEWPTFNVADVALVVGVGLLLISELGQGKRTQPAEPEPEPE